jgi:hypothetical protein
MAIPVAGDGSPDTGAFLDLHKPSMRLALQAHFHSLTDTQETTQVFPDFRPRPGAPLTRPAFVY